MADFNKVYIVGCGLTGSVIARELAEKGKEVVIFERRNHIGGNMYDYEDSYGFLVQKYGPHTFHTNNECLFNYMKRFESWKDYKLTCGAVWDGKYTPSPFNFKTIDTFFPYEIAKKLKDKIKKLYPDTEFLSVLDALKCEDHDIRAYAEYLFKKDYAPYTAKQWGLNPEEIDPSVLKRVPLRFSYKEGYFDDIFQAMPEHSFTTFFNNLLNHKNIKIFLNMDALNLLSINNNIIYWDGEKINFPVIYTGALDELFNCKHGRLPYRSLKFEWKYSEKDSVQDAPVVAYPQEKGFTRITEYKKIPLQNGKGSSYAIEYSIPYEEGKAVEPYYPVLTEKSKKMYNMYRKEADSIVNLFCAGRLADFKYYNMDQALENALNWVDKI